MNCYRILAEYFYPEGCRVYTENIRLSIGNKEEYRLPDVIATCSDGDHEPGYEISEPVMLVEVLSPATALQYLGSKLDSYRKIQSLQAYLIINPAEVWVRVYVRDDRDQWLPDQVYTSFDEEIQLVKFALTLALREIYRFVF